jgi:hypothetical protein
MEWAWESGVADSTSALAQSCCRCYGASASPALAQIEKL